MPYFIHLKFVLHYRTSPDQGKKIKHISLKQSQKMVQVPTDILVNWLQTENNSMHSGEFSRQTEQSFIIIFVSYVIFSYLSLQRYAFQGRNQKKNIPFKAEALCSSRRALCVSSVPRDKLVSLESAAKHGNIWGRWEKVGWLCAPAPPWCSAPPQGFTIGFGCLRFSFCFWKLYQSVTLVHLGGLRQKAQAI